MHVNTLFIIMLAQKSQKVKDWSIRPYVQIIKMDILKIS